MAARSVTARHSHEVVSRLMLSEQWPTAVVSEHTATSVVTLAAVTQFTSTTIVPINRGSSALRPGVLASVLGSARHHSVQYIGNQTNLLL